MLHSAGWLEGGLASCYEKFMMDIDQLGMQQKFAEGVDLSENGQAMDAIRQVGPGSHYLGCDHTQANFQTAFYRSSIADNNSVRAVAGRGREDRAAARQRARRGAGWRPTRRRRSIRASTRRCRTSSPRRRRRCPTPSPEGSPIQAGLKWPTSSTRKSGGARSPTRTKAMGASHGGRSSRSQDR